MRYKLLSICLSIIFAIEGVRSNAPSRSHCEPDWQMANGQCYKLLQSHANGQQFAMGDARVQCQSIGGDLAVADGCLPLAAGGCAAGHGTVCAKPFSNCPIGWYERGRTCYQLNVNQLSWDEAKSTCNQMGSDLMQITQEDIQKFLNGYLSAFRSQSVPYIWIGIYQMDRTKPLVWTSGPEVSKGYTNWDKEEPKLGTGQRNAGRVITAKEKGEWQIGVPTEKGGYVCELPLGAIPSLPTPDYKFSCPQGWQLFRGSCYQFFMYSNNWDGARAACRRISAVTDLIDIRDAAEQEFVQRNLNGRDIWTGLHSKPGKHGEWYWNDDQTMANYFNWNDGEPNNAGGSEYCVEIWANADAKWNDKPCNYYLSYACKRPADVNGSPPTVAPTTLTPKWDSICGTGWYRDPFTNLCYMINLEPMNWNDARLYCQSKRGDLASITSLSEKTLITGRIQGAIQSGANALAYWVGFNDIAEEGRWVWSDGSPVAFINWNYGEPNNYDDDEDCGQILPGTNFFWNDETCSRLFASVCKKPASDVTTVKPAPTTISVPGGQIRGCPSDYTGYNNMCYRLVLQNQNWDSARQQCKNEGGDLVSIENKQEHEFVYELVQKRGTYDIWIGLHDTASALRTMYFQWIDGAPVTFTYWNVGEPNDWQDKENCVEQYSTRVKGYWNDVSCTNLLPFVCKRREIAMVTTLPTTSPIGCPVGYDDVYNGNCYMYVIGKTPVSWTAANTACRSNGGLLVSIMSSEEQGHLNLKLYTLNSDQPFWMGLTRYFNMLYWTGGSFLTANSYTNWATGANTRDSYGMMYPSGRAMGTWSLATSAATNPNYVCKRRQDGPTTPTPPPTTYDPKYCAAGWVEADNTCYRGFRETISSRMLHWDEARVFCRHQGGDLASIHSENATEALRSVVVSSSREHYWIGLNSLDTDQSHRWTDGTSPNYFNWKPNEPNNVNNNLNCAQLDPSDMKWYVASCSATANHICETPKGINPANVTTMEPTTGPDDPDCGTYGWKYFRGSCYYVRLAPTDWFTARKYCRDRSADLVSVLGQDENDFVHRQAAKTSRAASYWIGLNELGQIDGYKWSDGNAVSYLNWKENEPNNAGGAEHCVTMHGLDGMWNDDQCGTSMPYICKKNNETAITDPPATPMPGECPAEYYAVGDKCFRLFSKTKDLVTWQEAFDLCAAWGGVNKTYLASISTEYEQAALISLAVDAEVDMWVGLHTRLTTPRKYVWIDNSQFTYSNWDRGEPNGNQNNPENCVEMYSQKYRAGKWNDIRCEWKRGYICMTHKQAAIRTTWPGPVPTKVLCSAGWTQYGSACFKFFDQPATWSSALKQCQVQGAGASLASVHDVWEQNYVHSQTREKPSDATWIGLSDQLSAGNFVWSDNWPVLYTYWGINQPNENTGPGCVRMDRNGKWFNGPCVNSLPFMCRISFGQAPTTPLMVPGRCPNDEFVQYGQHCYYISEARIVSNRRTFANAQLECKLKGGDLASIGSSGEQDFLAHTIAAKVQGSVLGSNYWIGMTRQLEDGFQWLDGSAVNYVHWAEGEPSDKDGSAGENCVEMYQLNYQWNDVNCGVTSAYVCKVPKKPFTAGTEETSPSTASTGSTTVSTGRTAQTTGRVATTSQPDRTTLVDQTGRIIPDLRNDLLVGGAIIGFVLVLLALVAVVFFYKRRNGGFKSDGEMGFANANWSKETETVTLDSPRPQSSAGDEASNPNFSATSPAVN